MNCSEKHDHLKRLQQETTLAKFGELALTSDNLDEILNEACRLVGRAMGTDLAKVMELSADGCTLFARAGVGWKPGVVGKVTLNVADNTSEGMALKTGEPMISPDIDHETRFKYPAFLTDNGVRAVANVLIIGGKNRPPYGILQIDSRKPRRFTVDDTTFLRSYANLLAAAVDRLTVFKTLRDGEARLRLAMEAGMLGSWDIDLTSGNATRSSRYDEIFGYSGPPVWSYDAFLGHVVAEDRDRVAAAFSHAVKTRVAWQFECRIHRASDGEYRWIEARGKPEGVQGSKPPARLVGIVADITDRKTAEEALVRDNVVLEATVAQRTRELTRRTKELTLANAQLKAEADERQRIEAALRQAQKMEAVGQLTGGIAHDLNNMLQGVSGSLQLIQMRTSEGRTVDIGRYINTALESTNRAAALTHRLLAFSRRQTLDPKPTDMNALVVGMEDLLRRTLPPSITFETSLADQPWVSLCDANQVENALLNLVVNARDAMPNGGHLLIETSSTVLRDRRGAPKQQPPQDAIPGDYIALSVVDTGTGMSPEVMLRAFEPFFTTKPMGEGTGLGLSMVYGFAQQSGGEVRLRSELEQGTTVTIYLPRYDAPEVGTLEDDMVVDTPVAVSRGVVLLVEDECSVRMVVADILGDLGYTVMQAEDGPGALSLMAPGVHLDLLLTDVGMPGGMNGRQLADAARQSRPNLKVLFITGFAESMLVGTGQMQHGMQVMTKPFSLDRLAVTVGQMISGSQEARPAH